MKTAIATFTTLVLFATSASAQGPAVLTTAVDPATGQTYHLLDNSDWTTAQVEAQALGGSLATVESLAENSFLTATFSNFGGVTRHLWIGYSDAAVEGTWAWQSGSTSTFDNWWVAGGSPNDSTANDPTGEDFCCIYPTGEWEDLHDHASSTFFPVLCGIVELPGGPTVQCDPANDHYLGNYAKLDSSAFGSGVGSDLHIEVLDGPAGEFGFLLVSPDGSANVNVFSGVLCLGAPQGRYNPQIATNQGLPQLNSVGQFDVAGVLQNLAGNATSTGGSGFDVPLELPMSPAGQVIAPGDTYYFQCWFRDQVAPLPNPGSSSNFSNTIAVVFP